jgi:hypothetical protein
VNREDQERDEKRINIVSWGPDVNAPPQTEAYRVRQSFACPNDPPCEHSSALHDIYSMDEPLAFCCVEGCLCGHAPDCQMRTPPPSGFPFGTFSCDCDGGARLAQAMIDREQPGSSSE